MDPKIKKINREARFIVLGDGSLTSCSPVLGNCEPYIEVECKQSDLTQVKAVVNESQKQAIAAESPIEEENHPRSESDEEFYGWDEESTPANKQDSQVDQPTTYNEEISPSDLLSKSKFKSLV